MTTQFPECPKCEQRAMHVSENPCTDECEEGCDCANDADLRCAACGHLNRYPTHSQLIDAREAEAEWNRSHRVAFSVFWQGKVRSEREKVARLAEGRW